MRSTIYNIIDEGRIIFTGTEREVQGRFHLSPNTRLSYHISYGGKIKGKYDIEVQYKPSQRVEYDFYENGEWVFRGTNKEFKDHFNVQFTGSVASYARSNSLILGRFRAYHANEGQNDKKLDYFAYHLEKYGNTVSKKDPSEYLDKLRDLGLLCTIRKCKSRDGRRRKDVFYVLERV